MEKVSKTLAQHMERISELVSRLDVHEKSLPQIERDMLLAALREMYDAVYSLGCSEEEEEGGGKKEEEIEEREEQPVDVAPESSELSVLMADVDAEPIYAADPDVVAQEEQASLQPSIEDIEGKQNEDLFEEEVKDEGRRNEEEEQPKTLWEKLNDTQKVGTIAETLVAARTISDVYEDKREDVIGKKEKEREKEEPKSEPKPQPQPEPEPEPELDSDPKPEADSKQPSLFDYFKPVAEKPVQRTLADSLGEKRVSDVDKKINSNKVSDLRTVININDKFSFMNELFHNNMKGYNDFIMRLNALTSREEALAYVKEISAQYKWDDESLTVKTFFTVFDRKF